MHRRISVIIPVLNEEKTLPQNLHMLQRIPGTQEVIVVDGGSVDATVSIARVFSNVRVLSAPRGRARQMNAGASLASGDVLLFLHADASLPADAFLWVEEVLREPMNIAGAFRTHTVSDDASWLSPALRLADIRSRYSRLPYGDQALFLRTSTFIAVGGFPDVPVMEDLELSAKLSRLGRIVTVPRCVRVSGRRFLARPVYYTLLVNILPALRRIGFDAHRLARMYGHAR